MDAVCTEGMLQKLPFSFTDSPLHRFSHRIMLFQSRRGERVYARLPARSLLLHLNERTFNQTADARHRRRSMPMCVNEALN